VRASSFQHCLPTNGILPTYGASILPTFGNPPTFQCWKDGQAFNPIESMVSYTTFQHSNTSDIHENIIAEYAGTVCMLEVS